MPGQDALCGPMGAPLVRKDQQVGAGGRGKQGAGNALGKGHEGPSPGWGGGFTAHQHAPGAQGPAGACRWHGSGLGTWQELVRGRRGHQQGVRVEDAGGSPTEATEWRGVGGLAWGRRLAHSGTAVHRTDGGSARGAGGWAGIGKALSVSRANTCGGVALARGGSAGAAQDTVAHGSCRCSEWSTVRLGAASLHVVSAALVGAAT